MIEDSVNGVKAAVAAGMDVIGAPAILPAYGDRLLAAGAHAAVDFGSLTRLVPERFVSSIRRSRAPRGPR